MNLLFDDRAKFTGPVQDRLDKLEELIGWPLEITHGIAKCYVKVSLKSYIYGTTILSKTDIYMDSPEAGPIICEITERLIDEILKIAEENIDSLAELSRSRPILQ